MNKGRCARVEVMVNNTSTSVALCAGLEKLGENLVNNANISIPVIYSPIPTGPSVDWISGLKRTLPDVVVIGDYVDNIGPAERIASMIKNVDPHIPIIRGASGSENITKAKEQVKKGHIDHIWESTKAPFRFKYESERKEYFSLLQEIISKGLVVRPKVAVIGSGLFAEEIATQFTNTTAQNMKTLTIYSPIFQDSKEVDKLEHLLYGNRPTDQRFSCQSDLEDAVSDADIVLVCTSALAPGPANKVGNGNRIAQFTTEAPLIQELMYKLGKIEYSGSILMITGPVSENLLLSQRVLMDCQNTPEEKNNVRYRLFSPFNLSSARIFEATGNVLSDIVKSETRKLECQIWMRDHCYGAHGSPRVDAAKIPPKIRKYLTQEIILEIEKTAREMGKNQMLAAADRKTRYSQAQSAVHDFIGALARFEQVNYPVIANVTLGDGSRYVTGYLGVPSTIDYSAGKIRIYPSRQALSKISPETKRNILAPTLEGQIKVVKSYLQEQK